MGRRKQGPTVRKTIRISPALAADIADAAAAAGHSIAEEIKARLERRPRRDKRSIRQRLMELEPMAADPSVPVAEVVAAMERINPYRLVPERRRPTQPPIPPRTMDPLQR